ncbi:universal stress protein E [Rhodovulum iodosum]|uniref:Universal stress protein E n=1 Tax=Rhodovulum iodosum TaxID=68291 RepID=A0ABV3XTN2_9RHOB|nr:universal stress protein [Rhodovulum robiginosum]RSK32134.1 universal stress protein UspA [Rhodovulum robiginosum]
MQRFKNILVVCDGQSAFESAFDRVAGLARANTAEVTLIDVVETAEGELARLFSALPGARGHEIEDQVIDVHRARLEALAAPLREQDVPVRTTVQLGIPFIQIIRRVLRDGHDLVVKGAQRAPAQPFLRGPDMHLMRKCPCPVWVLNSSAEPCARHILAAVAPDPDEKVQGGLNRTIMELATSLARQDEARLDVLNVWDLPEESTLRHSLAKVPPEEVDQLVANAERQSASRLQQLTGEFARYNDLMRVLHIKGMAADVILEHVAAEGIDTIVIGTLARTSVEGFFIGNTAETVLNRVTASVLAVKPKGFVSPVTLDRITEEALA